MFQKRFAFQDNSSLILFSNLKKKLSCRFYWILYFVFFVLLPINAPLEYWNDSVQAAIFVAFSLRYLIVLNVAWLINSAHFIWGLDKRFKPSDSNMIFLVTKTNWPQYHYLLPWDYQTGEFGSYGKHFAVNNIPQSFFSKIQSFWHFRNWSIDLEDVHLIYYRPNFRLEAQTFFLFLNLNDISFKRMKITQAKPLTVWKSVRCSNSSF